MKTLHEIGAHQRAAQLSLLAAERLRGTSLIRIAQLLETLHSVGAEQAVALLVQRAMPADTAGQSA
ncbi:hypothetical protein J7I98_32550 [Streptomyces sp. ISL-98]|uniref:hypothetical protein n=1 Tax=Streptomyces sp. ISL-98 TaxID=2819192 RepID=UPI001BE74DAD|nr:hypothetical protein [Streptomyces sp. ISL-98]MBT2510497.1 hypothetical protein [Streptomyces sp. ISL-98]